MRRSLDKAGVYLIHPPEHASVSLDRELLILFCPKYPRLVGAVLFDRSAAAHNKLYTMLEIARRRVVDRLDVPRQEMAIKALGMRHPDTLLMKGVSTWLQRHGLRLNATDVGKGLKRHCVIDAQTGQIGVRYESTAPVAQGFRLVSELKHFDRDLVKGRRALR